MAQRIEDVPAAARPRTPRPKTRVPAKTTSAKKVSLVEAGAVVKATTKPRAATKPKTKPAATPSRSRVRTDSELVERARALHPTGSRAPVVEHDDEPALPAPVVKKMAKADRKAKPMSLDERIAPAVAIGVLVLFTVLIVLKALLSGPSA